MQTQQSPDLEAPKLKLHQMRSELQNVKDIEYLGNIYIGTPQSQKAMVVFDTGSDWLTIKGCLTEAHCHTKKVKANQT